MQNNIQNNEDLILSLYHIGAIQFGEFKLKSGQLSPIYINLRKIISSPPILKTIANLMWEKTRACQFDLVCGVPYTALPIATCMSLEHNIPMIMRRKEMKDYGTKQMIEGEFKRGQSCLIVEDVITTGSSIMETAAPLGNAGLLVNDVVVLIDREQGGKENLLKHYRVHTILSLSDILQVLQHSSLLNTTEHSIVEKLIMEQSN